MKKYVYILAAAMLSLASCGDRLPSDVQEALDQTSNDIKLLELYITQFSNDPNPDNLKQMVEQSEKCHFEYSDEKLTPEQKIMCLKVKMQLDSTKHVVRTVTRDIAPMYTTEVLSLQDYLLKTTEAWPFEGHRGDKVLFNIHVGGPATIRIYNADSKDAIKTITLKNEQSISDSITIQNKAIYLLEVVSPRQQYADIKVSRRVNDIDRIGRRDRIETRTVEAHRGDFRAVGINGIQMKNLFEEPRKFTLRGQLKAAFSGSAKALVALQVPAGATDVMYSLRIATNERDCSSDGQFYDNMSTSYKKVKLLGLPLYESQGGSGLIATLLGENTPVREEDAYINMYVFYDAAQARKFQDGTPASQLKYNIDYSTLGTQSCNGRIPSRGCKTIYLAFENERMRYNNYVWLEAISAVPVTEYYKDEYTIR